ncbi:MAG: DUF885 domain-containing protein [Gammaproteobacteria bacterium]|nr:DUF885 domain-containing protein [Gammaproteobacteria bacterium]
MFKTRNITLAVAIIAVPALYWLASLVWFKPFNIDHFFLRATITEFSRYPEALSQIRLLEPWGITSHNHELNDESVEAVKASLARLKVNHQVLESYDYNKLSDNQKLSYDIMMWRAKHELAGEKYAFHNYPVNQLFGVQSQLPTFLLTMHSLTDKDGAAAYIDRLNLVDRKFQQVIESLKYREANGVIPPRFVINKVIAEVNGFADKQAKDHPLYTVLKTKMAEAAVLQESEQQNILAEAEKALTESVFPAYRKLATYLSELETKSDDRAGVWKLPDGDNYYQHMLRNHTTTNMTAEEIHQLGLDEVARIHAEMDAILASQGMTRGTVGERMRALEKDPRFKYENTEEAKKVYVEDYDRIISEINAGMSKAFSRLPAAPVEVQPIPKFKEKTAPVAYYNGPALDGSRPGVFYINLRNMESVSKYKMRSLAYHEAVPGHHFQIALQQEIADFPLFRKITFFTTFAEGWALYAERLAWELGYLNDPFDNLGRLQYELLRAVRLVVDTGLHYKRWSREQAIDYMESATGSPNDNVVAEIERYIVMPGQACAYKIGQLTINRLRDHAREKLGEKFSLKEFHAVVINTGSMPMEVLEKQVEQYIQSTLSSSKAAA